MNTAAIFHFMRIVELGLRALAKHLRIRIKNVPLEYNTWDKIIEALEVKVRSSKQLSKGKKKSEVLEFYNGLVGELNGFKDVWRNNIMHARKTYTEHEAKDVFERVRAFMQRLSTKVSE